MKLLVLTIAFTSMVLSGAHASNCMEGMATLLKNLKQNKFVTSRSLTHYMIIFGSDFSNRVGYLNQNDHWIDMGAGEAFAVRGYLYEDVKEFKRSPEQKIANKIVDTPMSQKPLVTAVGFKRPKRIFYGRKRNENFRYLEGRFVEDIPNEEFLFQNLKPTLITDVFGPIAYSTQPDAVLRKYMSIIDDQGEVWITMGGRDDHFGRFNYVHVGNEVLSLEDWIEQRLKGITIKSYNIEKRVWGRMVEPPFIQTFMSKHKVFRLTRNTNEPLMVPRLELVEMDSSTLAKKVFVEIQN